MQKYSSNNFNLHEILIVKNLQVMKPTPTEKLTIEIILFV
jgi:hypothetical protein